MKPIKITHSITIEYGGKSNKLNMSCWSSDTEEILYSEENDPDRKMLAKILWTMLLQSVRRNKDIIENKLMEYLT
jgi:hypothetical protein